MLGPRAYLPADAVSICDLPPLSFDLRFRAETEFNRCMNNLPPLLLAFLIAGIAHAAPIRVVGGDEQQPAQKKVYTNFLGNQVAAYLTTLPDVSVKSVSLTDPDLGLADD